MHLTLGKEDRRAVDLLLDRSAKAHQGNGNGHTVYASADATLGQRISQAHRLLQLLEFLPASDPPADLVARTIHYVEEYASRPAALRSTIPFLHNTHRPHA